MIYAFTEKSNIKCFSNVDERSSAFFALGLAKTTGFPVALISTSGTAPANYYPAIIEADLSRVPLVILSADRPRFLLNTGANQTINQKNLFGSHVRSFIDVGLPDNDFEKLDVMLEKAINNAIGFKFPPGPVHLNFQFDEPLLPPDLDKIKIPLFNFSTNSQSTSDIQTPILENAKRPLIVVGPMGKNNNQDEIVRLSKKIKAPILADPLSQLRYGYNSQYIIAHYDIFLKFINVDPDMIIRFGQKPTSKILRHVLNDVQDNTILIDKWKKYNDDCQNFIQSSIDSFCLEQIDKIDWRGDSKWIEKWIYYEDLVKNEIQKNITFHEGMIARICFESIDNQGQVFIGNSMPIRDVDAFTSNSEKLIYTFSNRGASGIDGIISTALGMSFVDNEANSILLIGDLSFYHDMNGLLATKNGMNLTIVIINNNGGGIFSFLPILDTGVKKYDEFWLANTSLDIEKVAELYSCKYYLAKDLDTLKNNIVESFNLNGVKIIEIKTVINDNIIEHRQFLKRIESVLS